MDKPENFRQFYNQSIQPELVRLDRERRRLLRLMFFSVLLLAVVIMFEMYLNILIVALYLAIPIGLYIGFLIRRTRKFVQHFKPNVVKLILDFIDDGLLFGDLQYDAKGFIPQQRFMESSIFGAKPAVYNGEDYITGRIGDIEFEMCELKVQEYSRVRARLDHVFRGVFIRAKFVTAPKGTLLAVPRAAMPQLADALKNFVAAGGENIDGFVRNDEFREVYTVYGSKNTRVNELLPEELMEFMLKYRQRAGEIYLSIIGKNIYAAITHEKDILEPKLFQSNVSFDLVREFYEDIYVAIFMVTALDKSF
ncbi:MAG: DUF3137 domain-containing protein [Saprospiraceae bacterium]|nr:MAG: DUF3137 domain-containing protein [Saprospiraceae bacterium]